jgi:4-carboxymuconolactone decarboxylase
MKYLHHVMKTRPGKLTPIDVEPYKLQALIAGLPTAFEDPRQQIVYELASTLVRGRIVPMGLFRRAQQALTDAGIVDVTVLMGWFTAVSLTLLAFDVPAGALGQEERAQKESET